MVGQQVLVLFIGVRVPTSELFIENKKGGMIDERKDNIL